MLFVLPQAVVGKVPSMFSIMYDVLTDAKLDSQQRVVEMLKESKVCRNGDTPRSRSCDFCSLVMTVLLFTAAFCRKGDYF